MYALIIADSASGQPRLAESRGALIVGSHDEMRRLAPQGALVLVPDGIGPWITADEVLGQPIHRIDSPQ